jgi:DNA-binding NtrC family response regulator/predicted hydrocarbon binding protein
MKVEDLDLKELLELDPAGGKVRFAGQRALIFDAVSQGLLRKELIESYGERTARGILGRYGYIHGRRLAETLKNKFKWDTEEDWKKAGARIYALQGLFMQDPDGPVTLSPEGGTWRVSYEAEQHLLHMGRSDSPVCWNLCGLISGYMSYTSGKEMYALEDKCVGKGDSACHVVIKSEEEWGGEAGGELAVFKRMGIDDALRDVTSTLKRTENELRERTRKLAVIAKIEEDPAELLARSPQMRNLMELAKTIAAIDSTVLITGESGTGKERVARFVHDNSSHGQGPFIAINCGAITETLLESELFGHARGAFTGASADRPGLFEAANGGTLFLDEVGEISLPMQVKLLRAIQEREVRRVGENKTRRVNVRIVSATNKDLSVEVAEKRFRGDLYYRLNVVELAVPPLRDRREDILPLARLLLAEAALQMKRPVDGLTSPAADQLLEYPWPGNVRELANAMERAVAVAKTNRVDLGDLPPQVLLVAPVVFNRGETRFMKDVERDCILNALEKTDGNRRKAADLMGLGVATLYRKLKAYKLLDKVKD